MGGAHVITRLSVSAFPRGGPPHFLSDVHSLPTAGRPLLSQLPQPPPPAGSPAPTLPPCPHWPNHPSSKSLCLGATPFLTWVLNLEIPVRSQELPGPTHPAPLQLSRPPLLTTQGPALTAPSSWKHWLPEHSSLVSHPSPDRKLPTIQRRPVYSIWGQFGPFGKLLLSLRWKLSL